MCLSCSNPSLDPRNFVSFIVWFIGGRLRWRVPCIIVFLFDLSLLLLPLTPAFPYSSPPSLLLISCIGRNYIITHTDMANVPIDQSNDDMAQALATSASAGATSLSPLLTHFLSTEALRCPFVSSFPLCCVYSFLCLLACSGLRVTFCDGTSESCTDRLSPFGELRESR